MVKTWKKRAVKRAIPNPLILPKTVSFPSPQHTKQKEKIKGESFLCLSRVSPYVFVSPSLQDGIPNCFKKEKHRYKLTCFEEKRHI